MAKRSNRKSASTQKIGRVRQFVEACGKHPFATGLFALLGIFGLLFSFVTFGIDQQQGAEDQAKATELHSSVKSVEQEVSGIRTSLTEEPIVDPIVSRAPVPDLQIDNVAFSGTPETPTVAWVLANMRDTFSNIWIRQWSLKSDANREYVELAPYLVLDVLNVEKIPKGLSVIYAGERGAAGELRSFEADLVPKRGLQFAPLVDDYGKLRRDVDYFSLSPKEPEEFYLSINYVPGYIYTYRIGIHYRFKGTDAVHWLTGSMRAGVPDYPLPVADFESGEFEVREHPDLDTSAFNRVPDRSITFSRAVETGKVFRPAQLPH